MSVTAPAPKVSLPQTDPAHAAAAAEAGDMPLPSDPKTIFLGGLFVLACLAVMYVAREVILPVVLALVLKLLLQPVVRFLERLRIPRAVGALVAVLLLLGVFIGLGTVLSGPASAWVRDAPATWQKLQEQYAWVKEPLDRVRGLMGSAGLGEGGAPVDPAAIAKSVAAGASGFASHLLETLLILFYFLVFGETLMRRLVRCCRRSRTRSRRSASRPPSSTTSRPTC